MSCYFNFRTHSSEETDLGQARDTLTCWCATADKHSTRALLDSGRVKGYYICDLQMCKMPSFHWPQDGFCSCSFARGQGERCFSFLNMWDRLCGAFISLWRRKSLDLHFHLCSVSCSSSLVECVSVYGSFLQALRRFIAQRGRPSTIYCDNGTNLEELRVP